LSHSEFPNRAEPAAETPQTSASVRRRTVLLILSAALAGAAWLAGDAAGSSQAALLLTGAGMGLALGHSGFGFAGAWRAALVEQRGGGLRAQLALLALLTVVFFPLLAFGGAFGTPLSDVVRPVGVSLIAGAFLFGVGAQFASACSSGSFCALGDAKLRYVIVLAGMVVGATIGSAHFGWWESRPRWTSFSMVRHWGPVAGIAVNLAIIGLITGLTVVLERARYGSLLTERPVERHWLRGPWPISRGVVVLAILCVATLLIAGRPWNIIAALPLWGARFIESGQLPFDITFWDYWAEESRLDMLSNSVWLDVTTVMIFGLVLGSMLAAALNGRLRIHWQVRPGEALGAVIGGLLLGYGGVVGLGCNIGAFLGGVSSGSLHGWIWLAAALAGTAAGIGILSSLNAIRNLLSGGSRRLSTASAPR
jgi:uncharacterized membrane protein YedE/YeeE